MNEETRPDLPSDLLHGIRAPSGGRVVLVLGAGCSNEEPTSLPLAGDLSENCYQQLVAEGVLGEGDVHDQRDLSAVAEAVYIATGSQSDLVDRFPPDDFRSAEPNPGYLIMAALLLEGALRDALTLNFDCAARTALAQLGARSSVPIIRGPQDHRQIGANNLIYLHGDIDSSPDELIMRKKVLQEAWQDGWKQIIAQRVLGGPVTVFVGLGSPTSVLVETTNRILSALDTSQASAYVVDPVAYEESDLASALGVSSGDYFQLGWGDLMRALAQAVVAVHRASIMTGCESLAEEPDIVGEDVSDLCDRLAEVGLPGLGQLRAAWMLHRGAYLPHEEGPSVRPLSDLVLAIRMIERVSCSQARFSADGLVEFCRGSITTQAVVCHGSGTMSIAMIEARIRTRRQAMRPDGRAPSLALVAGSKQGPAIATPSDIIAESHHDDIVTGPSHLDLVKVEELRADPSRVREVIQ